MKAKDLLRACLSILLFSVGAVACGSPKAAPSHSASLATSPVTAVPVTTPPKTSWNSIAGAGPSAQLGDWVLKDRFLVLAALADQGLATARRPGKTPMIVFRGDLSIPSDLRQQGWVHIGDPDDWHGYLYDAYQSAPGGYEKLFEVTTPEGTVHDFIHALASGEMLNNSFAAVSPDGQWLVSGEWRTMKRLLVFPAPITNPAQPISDTNLSLTGTIQLDHPVRDVQGCSFISASKLLCVTDDPHPDLWSTPRQLLQITLPQALNGNTTTGHVTDLGQLPLLSSCSGRYEVEGVDYDLISHTLRVEVRPPGQCDLAIAVYEYRQTISS